MFLRRLKLQNIRSIPELSLSFENEAGGGRAWTYLLGLNGTGKSTLLRAIALITAGGDAMADLLGRPEDWISLGQKDALMEVDFATADEKPRRSILKFQRGQSTLAFLEQNRATLAHIDAAVAKSERNYFVVGYGVSRRMPSETMPHQSLHHKSIRARTVSTLFNVDAPLVSLQQWAMDLEYRKGSNGLKAVRAALDTLLPEVTFDKIDRDRRQLMFNTADGSLPLSALSDGYQAMAAWCGDLLFQITEAFPDYRQPLSARGLLLIDEIDLHLHPLWQRQLVTFLKKTLPNMQVVATTHSPLTVHQADAGELYFLRRDEDQRIRLVAFEGAPNHMMLHQLLQTPAFGLETLDSPQVAELRNEARQLQAASGETSATTQRRLRHIKRELADIPDLGKTPPYLERTNALLARLSKHFDEEPAAPPSTRSSRRGRSGA